MTESAIELAHIAINSLVAIAGFAITFMIYRLYNSIDNLKARDDAIEDALNDHKKEVATLITIHREDVLANYASNNKFSELKHELVGRFDRFEDKVLGAIRNIP